MGPFAQTEPGSDLYRIDFEKLIVVDFYDGATDGVFVCRTGEEYLFELVTWDDQQDDRVFAFATIAGGTVSRIAESFPVRGGDSSGVSTIDYRPEAFTGGRDNACWEAIHGITSFPRWVAMGESILGSLRVADAPATGLERFHSPHNLGSGVVDEFDKWKCLFGP